MSFLFCNRIFESSLCFNRKKAFFKVMLTLKNKNFKWSKCHFVTLLLKITYITIHVFINEVLLSVFRFFIDRNEIRQKLTNSDLIRCSNEIKYQLTSMKNLCMIRICNIMHLKYWTEFFSHTKIIRNMSVINISSRFCANKNLIPGSNKVSQVIKARP